MSQTIRPTIIGADFSINKPAVCILKDNQYSFVSWPYNLSTKIIKIYKDAGIKIVDRTDNKIKGDDASAQMRYEVKDAVYLADLIVETIKDQLDKDTLIVFEGLSFGSPGNIALQLSSYKYILMDRLSMFVPFDNMYTYSPLTIKSTAGCSKKGTKKSDMIESFMQNSKSNLFNEVLKNNIETFKKKNSENWIDHLDDLIDSYFAIETLVLKEKL
jgi:hypothetical protein